MSKKILTLPSVVHTAEHDLRTCTLAIGNYLKTAGFRQIEIKGIFATLDNLDVSISGVEGYVNSFIPGKKNLENRQRLSAAMKEYIRFAQARLVKGV